MTPEIPPTVASPGPLSDDEVPSDERIAELKRRLLIRPELAEDIEYLVATFALASAGSCADPRNAAKDVRAAALGDLIEALHLRLLADRQRQAAELAEALQPPPGWESVAALQEAHTQTCESLERAQRDLERACEALRAIHDQTTWEDDNTPREDAALCHDVLGELETVRDLWADAPAVPTATGETETPSERYLMATWAWHATGDISRDEPDLAVIYGETDTDYIGEWVAGVGFINVRFPKTTTRELTGKEIAYYRTRLVELGGITRPIFQGVPIPPPDAVQETEPQVSARRTSNTEEPPSGDTCSRCGDRAEDGVCLNPQCELTAAAFGNHATPGGTGPDDGAEVGS